MPILHGRTPAKTYPDSQEERPIGSTAVPPLHLLRPVIRSEPFDPRFPTGLTRAEREHLSAIAVPSRLARDTIVYKHGDRAESILNLTSGAVRVHRFVGKKRVVLAFLFSGDLCGLAKNGVYVNSVQTLTPVTLFRIPLEPLTAMLKRDANLQFRFLCKAAHAVREMQRRTIVTGYRRSIDRVAAFISILERAQHDERDTTTRCGYR